MKIREVMMPACLCFVLSLSVVFFARPVQAEEGHEHPEETRALKLTLNDGQKWEADKHTADAATAMKGVLEGFQKKADGATVEDLNKLGQELEQGLHALIRGCTMKGPDHDQLHTWIALLAPQIQNLMNADQIEPARDSFDKATHLILEFDTYFERKTEAGGDQ